MLTAPVQLLNAQNAEQNSYPGEIRSRYETPMSFRVAGKVQLRFIDAGSQVKAGDLLAKLDSADSQAAPFQNEPFLFTQIALHARDGRLL